MITLASPLEAIDNNPLLRTYIHPWDSQLTPWPAARRARPRMAQTEVSERHDGRLSRRGMVMSDSYPGPAGHPTDRLVGTAPAMAALRPKIRHLAPFDIPGSPVVPTLLLQGETGTGKGLAARVIHDSGPWAAGPFIEVNCAAIPDSMLEAELFGFKAGPLPGPSGPNQGCSKLPWGARCSWMRWMRCRWRCKASF
jgi:transcriptional regulator with AAA-type ATPase domain